MTRRTGLSAAARAWAVDSLLSAFVGRWLEKLARAAASVADAADVLRDECGCLGYGTLERSWQRCAAGIAVEYDGERGIVTWMEIARAARGDLVQLELAL